MDRWGSDRDTRDGGHVRAVTRGRQRMLQGYAIVFNQRTMIGSPDSPFAFWEVIAPSAVDRTLREHIDLRALVNHDTSRVIGRQGANTLRVEVDHHGLSVEIDPPSWAADVVESVERGDLDGMSFGFQPYGEDGYQVDRSTKPPTLTLRDAIIREVSVVAFPAYAQTELAARALGTGRRSVSELLAKQPAWLRR